MGGAPVRVDGKLQLVEGPRFPPSFDQELAPVFNTNTALVDIDALDEDYDLTWLYVQKTVDGRDAVQLERLYHEVSALRADAVPRGAASRPARALPADQDAGRSRASRGRPPRARRSVADLTRTRHEVVTGCAPTVGVCACSTSSCRSAARSATRPAAALLRALPELADAARSARLRALRVARAVAGPALRRVLGAATRVLGRPRRPSSTTRVRERSFEPGRSTGGAASRARRRSSSPRSFRRPRRACLVPVPGDPERAWHRGDVPAARARDGARADLGAPGARRPRARPVAPSTARALARRAAPQRPRERRRACGSPRGGVRRRRRLHVRGDRRRLRGGVSPGRRATGLRRHLRAGRSLD